METSIFSNEDLKDQIGSPGSVSVSFHDKIALVTFERGQNRLNVDFITKVHAALDEVERNPAAEVLVTTSGGKFYSNGLDLDWLAKFSGDETKRHHFIHKFVRGLFQRLATFPMPTIAAVNGHAFAGGCMMALCHDYIVMSSDKGWICLNEVFLGMLFTPYMKNIIMAKLPAGRAMHEAMVLGKRFTAQEALDSRIVTKICSRENLVRTATDFGSSLVKRAPYDRNSLRNMKKDLYDWCFERSKL